MCLAAMADVCPGTGSRTTARRRLCGMAFVYPAMLTGTNLPSPLYRGYERAFGFTPLMVTLIFSAYVGVLIPRCCWPGPPRHHLGLLPAIQWSAAALALAGLAALGLYAVRR